MEDGAVDDDAAEGGAEVVLLAAVEDAVDAVEDAPAS